MSVQSKHGRKEKSIATDRLILFPGPAEEVQVVRDIYRMLIADGMTMYRLHLN